MKLLTITGRYYAFFIVGMILLGGVLSYEILKNRINDQFNNQLIQEKKQLILELESNESLRENYFLNVGDRIALAPVSSNIQIDPILSDTTMYDIYSKEGVLYRQYKFTALVDGQNYQVSIFKSLISTEELITGVGEIMLVLMAGLLLALVMVNRYLSRRVWAPFHEILNLIRNFDITKPFDMPSSETRVDEFKELNTTLGEILNRSSQDYSSLKEFTENSSHEIQTPLAIIKSKSELLLQSSAVSKEEILDIKSIYDSALRLSRLNQSLILLAKIESHQFITNRNIKIASFIDELLMSFSELIEIRKLKVSKIFRYDPELIINENLAYTLFSNLINNAIKHNNENGFIEVKVNETEIVFSNSGPPLQGDPQRLFGRFQKASFTSSPGLGLALVQKISDLYKLNVYYSYSGNTHKISLSI